MLSNASCYSECCGMLSMHHGCLYAMACCQVALYYQRRRYSISFSCSLVLMRKSRLLMAFFASLSLEKLLGSITDGRISLSLGSYCGTQFGQVQPCGLLVGDAYTICILNSIFDLQLIAYFEHITCSSLYFNLMLMFM